MLVFHDYDQAFTDLIDSFPEELRVIDGIGKMQLDMSHMSSQFFKSASVIDVSVDDNSNVAGKDVITYSFEIGKPMMRLNSYYNLWTTLKELYDTDTANQAICAQVDGDIYINDSWDIGRPYCFNFSTLEIALGGLKMSSRLDIQPPKSLYSFLRQVEQFVAYASNSCLGATGLADILLTASIYVQNIKRTKMDHKQEVYSWRNYVRELLTSFIYTLNWEFRGNQSPFTNVSVYDEYFLSELIPFYQLPRVDSGPILMHTVMEVQEIFLECMNELIERTQATFPVITACFSMDGDEIQDDYFLEKVCEANKKFGFINFYHGKTSTLSSCCRLRSDRDNMGYVNSFGAGGTKIGSLGVVTINLPRIAKLRKDLNNALRGWVRLAAKINHAKRMFIKNRIEKYNALPLYSLGHMALEQQYSTVGFIGLHEACESTGTDKDLWLMVLDHYVQEVQEEFQTPHNLEQIPGESAAVKLVKKDHHFGINLGVDLYSNQFIPLDKEASITERVVLQGKLDKFCTGGSIMHLNLSQPFTNTDAMMDTVRWVASKGVIYWAINHVLHVCNECRNVVVGGRCETYCCGVPTEKLTRVVGFLTKTKHWNATRQEKDFPRRNFQ